jgi:hypothetical protein
MKYANGRLHTLLPRKPSARSRSLARIFFARGRLPTVAVHVLK